MSRTPAEWLQAVTGPCSRDSGPWCRTHSSRMVLGREMCDYVTDLCDLLERWDDREDDE